MNSSSKGMDPMFPLPPKARAQAPPLSQARDVGTQTREFHAWTMRKLEVLTAYFKMYRTIAGGGTYLDGFAGSGHATIDGQLTKGSALRALESGAFKNLILIEKDPATHARLTGSIAELSEAERAKVHLYDPPADCNLAISQLLADEAIDRDKACFAFLDPDSTELAWTTVEKLARYKTYLPPVPGSRKPERCKIELWILVNTHHAMGRLMPADRIKHREPPHAHVLDYVMGGRDAWWDLWLREWGGPDLMAHRYAERLQTVLGYRSTHHQLVHDPDTGRAQYYMVHASDHPNAHSIMRSAKKEKLDDPPQFRGMRPKPTKP